MNTAVTAVAAVFFAGMGLYGLAAPAALIRPFGIDLATATARTEVRAVYGGFGVAIAAVLVYALVDDDARSGIVIAVGVALIGMAFGRLVARAVEAPGGFYPSWFYFFVEAIGGGALLTVGLS